jgi:hypothetical protein
MEDASAEDLDWFWRGWFYSTDPVDISLDTVKAFSLNETYEGANLGNGDGAPQTFTQKSTKPFDDISKIRNRQDSKIKFAIDEDPSLVDAYTHYKPWETADSVQTISFGGRGNGGGRDTFNLAEKKQVGGSKYFYEITCSNKGGLVMPVIIEWTFKDGTKEIDRIPVQIWRLNENKITKVFMKNKEVVNVKLDPLREIADINEKNNVWPINTASVSTFQLFKARQGEGGRGARGASSGQENLIQKEAKKAGKELKPLW